MKNEWAKLDNIVSDIKSLVAQFRSNQNSEFCINGIVFRNWTKIIVQDNWSGYIVDSISDDYNREIAEIKAKIYQTNDGYIYFNRIRSEAQNFITWYEINEYDCVSLEEKLHGYDISPVTNLLLFCKDILNIDNTYLEKPNTNPGQLETNLTDKQREALLSILIKEACVSPDTDKESFIWAFGGNKEPKRYIPIKWIVKTSITKNFYTNKKALLDLLNLLNVVFNQIRDIKLLKSLFAFEDGKPLQYSSKNYIDAGSDFISEYHQKLKSIVQNIKI